MRRAAAVVVLAFLANGCSVQLPPRDRVVGVAPDSVGVVVFVASARGSVTQWELDDSARILSAEKARTPPPARTVILAWQTPPGYYSRVRQMTSSFSQPAGGGPED